MARKRVIEAQSLKSWEDVNDALRQIAEAQIALGDIESDMQKQIVGAKKVAEDQSKPYKDAIARLEHMDAVYESLVRQIAGDKLLTDSGESLKESVERDEKKKQLEKQISVLENKMRREKQLNRRMEMNAELKQLQREWRK